MIMMGYEFLQEPPFDEVLFHGIVRDEEGRKMSKSLGNFFTIRDILQSYDPEVVRFFILTAHYRSPIDFSDQNLQDSLAGLSRFYEALQVAAEAMAELPVSDAVSDEGAALEAKFREAMDDDFNSAQAIGHLFEGVRTMNRLCATKKFRKKADLVAAVQDLQRTVIRLGGVLGLFGSEPSVWLDKQKFAALAGLDISAEEIKQFIAERNQARKDKDFARSDAIRDELDGKGIVLLDSAQGTSWKIK